jgi:hypothetical protein
MPSFLPIGTGSPRTLARQKKRLGLVKEYVKYEINENFFFEWSDELAWVLGLIWTDGNINGNQISICSKDVEMLEIVNVLTENKRPIKERKNKIASDWVCSNKIIANRLREIGLYESKSLTIGMPNIPHEFMPGFIRGCIDGDGSIRLMKTKSKFNGTLSVYICGKSKMHKGIQEYFESIDIDSKYYIQENGVWRVQIFKADSIKTLGSLIYSSSEVPCLKRKRDIYEYWLNVLHPQRRLWFKKHREIS